MFHTPAHKQTDPAQQPGQLSPATYTPAKPTDYHSVYGQQKYRDGVAPNFEAAFEKTPVVGTFHGLPVLGLTERDCHSPEWNRVANHIDGYDRDDLGESPDF